MTKTFTIASHSIFFEMSSNDFLWKSLDNYHPFVANSKANDVMCHISVVDSISIYRNRFVAVHIDPRKENELLSLDVYKDNSGNWLIELICTGYDSPNAILLFNSTFNTVSVALNGGDSIKRFALDRSIMLSYLLSTATKNTLLTHSSCVVNDGKAYLFLGKSGTGKSTHSSLWLKHIAGTTLLNDDHPILRVKVNGEVIAYGSPWSGKTPCYKNEAYPVGGIIRIRRALENSIVRLGPVQSYASLTTSMSGMTFDRSLAESRHQTIAKIIERVPCYTLNCLPDEDAAHVCHSEVAGCNKQNNKWKNI